MKKLIGFFVVCGFFLFSGSTLAAFSDIRSGSELETYIDHLVEKGIISGYPDGSFQPERTINRAEALKIIFETIERQLEEGTNSGFPDVPPDEWFAKYVTTAKKKDIIKGYPDGKYRPTQEVNRAEFIKMVMSALPFFNTTPQDKSIALQQYSDVYDLWYTPYVSAGLQLGFLSKTAQLKPTTPMQRQDAVEIVYRIARYLEEHPSSLSESDIPYIPEESFTVIDPTSEGRFVLEELPKDQVMIVRKPFRFEVYSYLHGFNIAFDDDNETRGKTNIMQPSELTLDNRSNNCQVYVNSYAYPDGESAAQTRQRMLEEEEYGDMYPKTIHVNRWEKLPKYESLEAYKHIVEVTWEKPDGDERQQKQQIILFGPQKIHIPHIPGYPEEVEKCQGFLETILTGFSNR